ncbi:MAG: hypothetical protein AB1Z98_29600, partial [Nannocystaceae bacterium]
HGVTNPEVSLGELMAAAACLRGARQYGREVSMYRLVLQRRPQAPIASEATRSMGLRLEQMDERSGALDTFEDYLKRFPKQADARAVGTRAVCLARTLGDSRREEHMLGTLERNYGREGFARPEPEQLPALCGETNGE